MGQGLLMHALLDRKVPWLWTCLALFFVSGCKPSEKPPAPDGPGVGNSSEERSSDSARQLLGKLVNAYREAGHYQDRGEVTLRYRLQGSTQQDRAQLVTRWSSSGRLYMRCYQLEVACQDGRLKARMYDQATADLDSQVLSMPASEDLSLDTLFSDPLLMDMLLAGRVGVPLPVVLLMDPVSLADQLGDKAELKLLEDRSLREKPCQRLQLSTGGARFVLWIDAKEMVVMRQEFPVSLFADDLAEDPRVSEISLQADFHGAGFFRTIAESGFLLNEPANPVTVGHFVLPPAPPATDLYGRRPGRFELVDAEDEVVTRDSLRGRISVLLWCRADESSRQATSRLAGISATWPETEDLQAFAVFVDPEETPTETITARLQQWEASMPLLRDLDGLAGEALQIQYAPTLVVLSAEGMVQAFLPAVNEEQLGQIDRIIMQLRAGKDLAAQFQQQQLALREEYEKDLVAAARQAAANDEVAEAAQPERFVVEQAWIFKGANAAGNMLLLPDAEQEYQVLVVDDGKAVIQLDATGKVLATHPLPVEDDRDFMMLRAATSRNGEWNYAVMTPGARQVLVLDQNWQQKLAYPDLEQPHDGISQVVLTDLEDDGQLELYVAFWGLAGVHRVEMDGERKWRFRGASDVISLVASPRNDVGWQKLLLTDQQGQLLQLNQFGNADPVIDTGGVPLHHLFAGNLQDDALTRLCALSSTLSQLVVGLDLQLRTRWRYPVELGIFVDQVEMVTSAQLSSQGGGAWLVAAANGLVHMVAHDGSFADTFAVGEGISGITAGRFGDDTVVLIATGKKVTCWKITARE